MTKLTYNCPIFSDYVIPRGYLDTHRESHALFYYYLCARSTYERVVLDPVVLEGDKDPEANFAQLFTSIAELYGVQPEAMAKCWDLVDSQCRLLNIPKMPDEDKYRFNRVDVITTIQ